VKIGWSKRGKKEYRHKAPRRVVDCLVRALAEAGCDGDVVTTDRIFTLVGANGVADLPLYQCYVALRWMCDQGIVTQHGRQGYTVTSPQTLSEQVGAAWESMKAPPPA
jgi:hypothetical protein